MNLSYRPIHVIVADDHEIFREGFYAMLKKQKEIELIADAEDGKELIELCEKLHPDVVVTDIKMPRMDGVHATKIIHEKMPAIQVIALSMFNEDNLIVDMLEAGARGYLLKNTHKAEIIEAIKTVYNLDTYYCKSTTNKLIQLIAKSKFNPYKQVPKPEFSPREIEIIKLICEEFTNKEIASRLFISMRTVEGHREKIQEKMKVRNTAGIVVYAIRHGIYKV
ncbi:MAG: DNA-binding response regulator [Bacteroidetes bacterium]|nr:MAG: DNA-binding response regulator [Bacteroidota bacterium]